MKYLRPIWAILPFFLLAGCTGDSAAFNQLNILLKQKDYFKLATRFDAVKNKLDEKQRLFIGAFIDNAFNRNTDCIADVDNLFAQHNSQLPDSEKIALYRLQGDSYFKTFQYAKAAKSDSDILKNYTTKLSKDKTDDIKNDLTIRLALENTPAQQTIIDSNTTIHWSKNKIGLTEIPITCNKSALSAIFDTRANISTITKTYATKLGLHILNVSYNEGSGATGIQFKTGMGIADSLYIGGILIKNVVFQVMPDTILYIAPIQFQMNIIIGFPVIEQLHQVDVYSDGRMVIPAKPVPSDIRNFALDGLDPVIALKTANDTLPFHFDSGASSTDLYEAYFKKYQASVLKNGIKKTLRYGGAGGVVKKQVYILPSLKLTLGDKAISIDSVSVLTKKITPDEKFYGNIGQDFLGKFRVFTYNFKYMYVKGE